MHTPDPRWQLAATGAPRALQRQPSAWWQRARVALQRPVWPAVVAALMALGLLLAFQQVVARGVAQGDLRRAAAAAHGEAVWRCNLRRALGDRQNCLVQAGGS